MADGDDLTVTISADTGDVASKLDDLATKLDALQTSFDAMASATTGATSAVKQHGEATSEAGEAAHGAAEHTAEHANIVSLLGQNSLVAADALEALGLEGMRGAERLSGLGEVLEKISEAAPALLAMGGAIAALSAGFALLADGIKSAAESQRDLVSIGVLIRNQGGDWKEATDAVAEYSEALAKAGIESRGSVLQGMQAMLVAGVNTNDMLRSQTAAQDLAIAKNEPLVEAEEQLAMAYDGRMREMQRLGLVTKAEVEAGLPYEELLQRIEERMGGAAAAALETYTGKQQNLANNFEALTEQIGNALLPVFSDWVDMLRLVVQEAAPVTDLFVKWITQHLPELREGITAFGRAFGDLVANALPPFLAMMENALLGMARLGDWIETHEDTFRQFFYIVLAGGATATLLSFGPMVDGIVGGLTTIIAMIQGTGTALDALAISEAAASLGLSLVITGAVLGAADIIQHWDEVKGGFDIVWNSIKSGGLALVDALKGAFADLADSAQRMMASMEAGAALMLQNIPGFGGLADTLRQQSIIDYNTASKAGASSGYGSNTAAPTLTTGSGESWGSEGWGSGSGSGNASWGTYTGPPATHPSTHQIPGTAHPQAGEGEAAQAVPYNIAAVDSFTIAQKGLDDALKHVDDSERGLEEAAKLATSAQAQQNAQSRADAQVIIDLETKQGMLTQAVSEEAREQSGMHALQVQATLDYQTATDAYNKYDVAHKDGSKQTAAEKTELADLKTTMDAAKKTMDDYDGVLKTVTENLGKNRDALADVNTKIADFTTKTAEAVAAADRDWEQFQIKTAEKYNADLETFHMTNAQKVVYYADALAKMRELDVTYQAQFAAAQAALLAAEQSKDSARIVAAMQAYETIGRLLIQNLNDAKQADTEEVDAQKAALEEIQKAYEKQVEAQKQIQEEELKTVNDFLDQVVLKHKSLGDELKSIYAQIEQSFLSMISGMITGSSGFQNAMQHLGIGGANAQQPGGGLFSGFMSAFSGGASGTGTPKGTSSDPITVTVADSSPTQLMKMTGNATGVFPGSITADANTQNAQSYTSIATNLSSASPGSNLPDESWFSGNPATGVPSSTSSLASQISTGIVAAFQGAAVGGVVASVTGGNSTNASIGGALGGIASDVTAANPVAGAALEIGAALIGGLVGPHETAAQQPDLSEPTYGTNTTYGQFISNVQGQGATAGGTTYNPTAAYSTALGGTSEAATAMSELQNVLAQNSGASAQVIADAKQLQALTNGDTAPNALNITGEKQGMFTLQSGAQVSVQQFMTEMQNFMTDSGSSAGGNTPALTNAAMGQLMANLSGATSSFGGTTFTPTTQNNIGLGGLSQSSQVMTTMQGILAPNSGAPSQLLSDAQALQALLKGDSSSNALSIVSDINGVVTLASGAKLSAQQYYNDVTKFLTDAGGVVSAIPTFTVSRDFQNANASTLTANGTTPGAGILMSTGAVVVNVTGGVYGSNGLNELATTVAQTIYQQQRGTAPTTGRRVTSGAGF